MSLTLRLLWRDWKSGQLALLLVSMMIAVGTITGIALFASRIENSIMSEASEVLAGDAQISGSRELPGEWLVVPVPLHRWRLWRRRFNQAMALAAVAARQRLDHFLQHRLASCQHGDIGAQQCQFHRRRAANAVGGTANQGMFAGQRVKDAIVDQLRARHGRRGQDHRFEKPKNHWACARF